MTTADPTKAVKRRATPNVPYFVVHASFEQTGAAELFGARGTTTTNFSPPTCPTT